MIAASLADASQLRAVRHWSAPDHTRIVIDLSEPGGYTHRTLSDPPRIAVDISGGSFDMSTNEIPIGDGLIERIRFNRLSKSGKAQVVLDLVQESRYDVFALEPVKQKPDRIVIDVKRPLALREPVPTRPPKEQLIESGKVGDFLVMVDPGHGGEDPGRMNPDGLKEKDLALDISRAIVREINKKPGIRAELTRTGDYFISLGKRRKIAEQRGADLFVSMHYNSAPSRKARGTEVFFVSLRGAEDRETRELERVENSADLVGGVPARDEETMDDVARMIIDLRQSDSVERSQQLAIEITDEVRRNTGMPTRNVKQAAFAVLKSLFIPAVLVEVGFLTNKSDLRYVRSDRNRDQYARAVANGIERYVRGVEMPRVGWRIHTVSRGESLSGIAAQYAMAVDALREANSIQGDKIRVGQQLRVRPR